MTPSSPKALSPTLCPISPAEVGRALERAKGAGASACLTALESLARDRSARLKASFPAVAMPLWLRKAWAKPQGQQREPWRWQERIERAWVMKWKATNLANDLGQWLSVKPSPGEAVFDSHETLLRARESWGRGRRALGVLAALAYAGALCAASAWDALASPLTGLLARVMAWRSELSASLACERECESLRPFCAWLDALAPSNERSHALSALGVWGESLREIAWALSPCPQTLALAELYLLRLAPAWAQGQMPARLQAKAPSAQMHPGAVGALRPRSFCCELCFLRDAASALCAQGDGARSLSAIALGNPRQPPSLLDFPSKPSLLFCLMIMKPSLAWSLPHTHAIPFFLNQLHTELAAAPPNARAELCAAGLSIASTVGMGEFMRDEPDCPFKATTLLSAPFHSRFSAQQLLSFASGSLLARQGCLDLLDASQAESLRPWGAQNARDTLLSQIQREALERDLPSARATAPALRL